jgi:hypothetical protein
MHATTRPNAFEKALVSEILSKATKHQQRALWSYAMDERGAEVTRSLHVTPQCRALHVQRLAERLGVRDGKAISERRQSERAKGATVPVSEEAMVG